MAVPRRRGTVVRVLRGVPRGEVGKRLRPFQRWPVLIAATVAEVCRRESSRTMGTNNNAIIIRSMCWDRNVYVLAAGCAHMPDWICAIVFAPDCGHTNVCAQKQTSRLRLPHGASLRTRSRLRTPATKQIALGGWTWLVALAGVGVLPVL